MVSSSHCGIFHDKNGEVDRGRALELARGPGVPGMAVVAPFRIWDRGYVMEIGSL